MIEACFDFTEWTEDNPMVKLDSSDVDCGDFAQIPFPRTTEPKNTTVNANANPFLAQYKKQTKNQLKRKKDRYQQDLLMQTLQTFDENSDSKKVQEQLETWIK